MDQSISSVTEESFDTETVKRYFFKGTDCITLMLQQMTYEDIQEPEQPSLQRLFTIKEDSSCTSMSSQKPHYFEPVVPLAFKATKGLPESLVSS